MTLLAAFSLASAVAMAQQPATTAVVDPATVEPGTKAVARRVTMVISSLDRSVPFYSALGFREDRRVEVTDAGSLAVFGLPPGSRLTFVRMTSDNTLSTGRLDGGTIGLAEVHDRKLHRLRDRTGGETMIGTPILVMTTDGVDAVHARLAALGAEILAAPADAPGGMRSMIARDPDGTRLEITQLAAAKR
jgi:catechol 2,3-dioxygenase-like lactoylglutathione lyase family enzyme